MFNLKKNKRGFTYIELIVSMSIIVLLSGMSIASFNKGRSQSSVNLGALQLSGDIRKAQNYAMGLKKPDKSSIIMSSWCLYFQQGNSNYTIFVDDKNESNKIYNSIGGPETESVINLPPNTSINSLKNNDAIITSASICFRPPDPEVYIAENNNPATLDRHGTLEIELANKESNKKKYVSLNFMGLVDVGDNWLGAAAVKQEVVVLNNYAMNIEGDFQACKNSGSGLDVCDCIEVCSKLEGGRSCANAGTDYDANNRRNISGKCNEDTRSSAIQACRRDMFNNSNYYCSDKNGGSKSDPNFVQQSDWTYCRCN